MKIKTLLLPLLLASFASAELAVDPIYASHMVLQHGKPVVISGTSDKSAPVTVTFAGQTVKAKVARGKWQATLQPLDINAEGADLTISQNQDSITLEDVLVGEVWLASGQSNMLWRLNQTGDRNAIAKAANPQFRFYHAEPQVSTDARVFKPEEIKTLEEGGMYEGSWSASSPESCPRMSAVGFYFGQNLQRTLGVPVGVVHTSLGGSEMIAWMPTATLKSKYRDALGNQWVDCKYMTPWLKTRAKQNVGNDLSLPHPYKPAFLFESGISQWKNFTFAGVIWYQGETDAENPDQKLNCRLLSDLVTSWRGFFGDEELPFLMVQLPRINDKTLLRKYWPEFRQVQDQVADDLPRVFTSVTIDLGSADSNVHPPRKKEVGERLANLAAAQVYGKKVPFSGPVFDRVEPKGSSLVVRLKHAEGLATTDGQPPVGFEVSANGKKFFPASAEIDGDTIVLTSPEVRAPKHARYAWATYLEPNLTNADKLPTAPFTSVPRKGKKK